jgi:SAM-dependent methyltransferase
MNSAEYANLEKVERDNWYYAGKREMVRRWLGRAGPLAADGTLLDCGAGTGRFAEEMAAHCRVLVLDDHEESLRLLRTRFKPEQILTLSGERIPLPDGAVNYVTALDVLEHVPDDAAVVREFRRLLPVGGIAAVTVPASMALWSDWDVSLHHFRRYDRAGLRALFPPAEWEIVYVNYTNVVLYPVVWGVRKWRLVRRRLGFAEPTSRAEDRLPPRWINALLRTMFAGMAQWRVPFPFGVSLLLIARRRAD